MTPTKNESLPELVARWRREANDMLQMFGDDQSFVCVADALRKMSDELEAALTREAPTEGVGGEWVLVPREPTTEMQTAGWGASWDDTKPKDVWAAMLAAAPAAPAAGEEAGHERARLLVPVLKKSAEYWGNHHCASELKRAIEIIEDLLMTATPPAPQRLAQGYALKPWDCPHRFGTDPRVCLQCGWDFRENGDAPTQPPHHDRGEVKVGPRISVFDAAADPTPRKFDPVQASEELGAVSGTLDSLVAQIVAEFPMVAIVRAFDKAAQGMGAALTEAKQQGPGEAVATIKLQSKERTMDRQPTVKCDDCGSDNDFCVYDGPSGLLSCTACGQMKQLPIATPQVEAKRQTGEGDIAAAERLCRIYFEIAADAIGEDAVRAERDKRIQQIAAAAKVVDHG